VTSAKEEVDPVFAVALPRRPYPGLRPFTKDEWPIFFGRERMADDIVSRLIEKRLLVVHGDSGCGKSSLIAAAVLPRLEQESARGGLRWATCVTRPGDSPLWNLARDLATLVDGGNDDTAIEIRRMLNFGRGAPAAVAALLRKQPDDCVCILIDQFEELFAHAHQHGPDEANLLTGFLVAAREVPPDGLYVVLTMRSEFLGACARFDGFAEAVNATQYLLPRLGRDDMLRAIREPATLYNGEVTRELADRLIGDASGGQDQLPLMQHGLMLLHRDSVVRAQDGSTSSTADDRPWRLDLEHYQHRGGLKTLLSDHADAVMQDALSQVGPPASGSRVVEDMFRALTDINAEGQAIRRPQTFSQLMAVTGATDGDLRGIVNAFRAEGVSFLRPYGSGPLDAETRVDISHEALIRCWNRIADPADGWLIREFRNGLVWRSLLVQADSFERDRTSVLAPTTTDERDVWMRRRNRAWAERYGGGWDRVQKLLRASADARDKERGERAAAHEREERLKRRDLLLRAIASASVVLVVMLALALYFYFEGRKALDAKNAALTDLQQQISIANNARSQAEDERRRSEQLTTETQKSADTLRRLGAQIRQGRGSGTAATAAREIDTLATQLNDTAQAPSRTTLGPRVYLHITDEKYRAAAHTFELGLEATEINGAKIVVPGIELVSTAPSKSLLRCFREDDCKTEAPVVLKAANALLRLPQLELQDMSARYGQSAGIRPRHYEIWFAPGVIALSGKSAQ
jgi:conflict system STAND superfamily ATPase